MRTQTHIAGAATFYGGAAIIGEMPFSIGTVAVAALTGILPDIDTRASTIGRLCMPVSGYIERRWGHRTITHSYLAQTLVIVLCLPLLLTGNEPYFYAAVLGYVSHPFLDTMTIFGVRLFWPWTDIRCVFPFYAGRPTAYRTETGQRGDKALCALFYILLIPIVVLKVATYERVIRVLQADSSSAVRDFLEMSATNLVRVNLRAEDPGSGRKLEGTFEAVGTIDYNTLLVRDSTGTIFSVGEPYSSNFLALSAVCERGRPVKISSRTLAMTGRLLADLEEIIPFTKGEESATPQRVQHFINGTIRIEETADITPDPHHFNPVRNAGPMIYLNYATLEDLQQLGLAGALVKQGSITLRLFLSPDEFEQYQMRVDDRRLQRVIFHYPRSLRPRLLVRERSVVAVGDTLALLDSEAIALARQRFFNLIKEKEELRDRPLPASQQKTYLTAQHRLTTTEQQFAIIAKQFNEGYASEAQLSAAASAREEAALQLALVTEDQERLRADHQRRLRDLDEQIAAARLRMKESANEHVITTNLAGTIMHIELRSIDDDKSQVRVLLSSDSAGEAAAQ